MKINIDYKVLTIGPDIRGKGGIAEVLKIYRDDIFGQDNFLYLPSNSRRGTLMGLYNTLICFLRIPRLKKDAHIMHLHISTGKSFFRKLLIALWGKVWGYKIIGHWHGGRAPLFFKNSINRFFLKQFAMISHRLICLSPYWRDFFSDFFEENQLKIIYNPIKLQVGHNNRSYNGLRILFMGKITKGKGVFDLIEAVTKLSSREIIEQIVICGEGEIDKLQSLVKKYDLEKIVNYKGWVDGSLKMDIINDNNIIILPSYAEALPMVLLEGLCYGKALIGTDVGGVRDIISDGVNGFLLEKGDIEGLAQKIIYYAHNPGDIKIHGENSNKLAQNFTVQLHTEKLKSLYGEMMIL